MNGAEPSLDLLRGMLKSEQAPGGYSRASGCPQNWGPLKIEETPARDLSSPNLASSALFPNTGEKGSTH